MPCRDYYDDHPQEYYGPMLADKDKEIAKLKRQISFAESALCGTLAALKHCDQQLHKEGNENDYYGWIDFNDAGITRDSLKQWHKKHMELDAKHRAAEAEAVRIANETSSRSS